MNRLYVVETELTVTGARADNRLAVRPSQVETFARDCRPARRARRGRPQLDERMAAWADAVAKDLTRRGDKARPGGTTAVLAGDRQPPAVHALAHAINHRLGNVGKTALFTEPLPSARSNSLASLEALTAAIDGGAADTLLILGGNPVYTAPADQRLGEVLRRKLERPREQWLAVRVGEYFDESSRLCHWHVLQRTSWRSGATASPTTAPPASSSR
ncbi:MAG: hypothetical protein U0797_03560 [Gemmataceae bacterium]